MKFLRIFLASLLAFIVGSFLTAVIWVIVIAAQMSSFSTETKSVDSNSVLVIDMAENISDSAPKMPFAFSMGSIESNSSLQLLSVLRAIETAKGDDRIKGICIKAMGEGSTSLANLEEIRAAIEDFKSEGKFVVAYNNGYTNASYYLSSVADKIYMQPEGEVLWSGLSSTLLFFKGAMDKLGISARVFRPTACRYKSAVEPYFRESMSAENREQMTEILQSMWDCMTEAVAASRGIEAKELNRLADGLEVVIAEDAVKNHLIDALIFEDQMKEIYEDLGVKDSDEITLGEYVAQMPADLSGSFDQKIGIVYAEGQIFDGEGTDDAIYSKNLCSTLEKVLDDDDIKALVLRVNSPGGSALASDEIWRKVELIKAKKPVIISMGGYAASGGYYISCGADAIITDRTTLTGSIGVFGVLLNGEKLLNSKLGVTSDCVSTNPNANLGANLAGLMVKDISPAQASAVTRMIDKVYTTFTTKVAGGRNLDIDKVLGIAGGRVWSGSKAVELGLADANGGLKAAISVAADKAGIADSFQIEEVTEDVSGFQAFLQMMGTQARAMVLGKELTRLETEHRQMMRLMGVSGAQALCPMMISVE